MYRASQIVKYYVQAVCMVCFAFISIAKGESLPKLQVVTEEWLPYNYLDSEGKLVGRATKKVHHVLKAAGVEYEIGVYPWVRAMKMVEETPNTMIFSIFRTEEREKRFHWACPLLGPVKEYMFKLSARKDIKFKNLNEAKHYITSIVKDSVGYVYLKKNGFEPGVNLDVSADATAIPRKLVAGRVDLTMTTEYSISEALKRLNLPYETVERVMEVHDLNDKRACMAFNLQTDPALMDAIINALAVYNADPTLPVP
ncbi:putative ABC transporter, periplasmic substrate-binding protein [Pseudoalteromonas luteoviolacea B = ATCC 29581]|nr:putative ABC transporter, periplasmic substrate-binding protein [Pseudoalteromonas luteoviolacea B = ATCC 29581]